MTPDYQLNHCLNLRSVFESEQPARWSSDMRRWLVFDAKIIRSILKDKRFSVPSYDLSSIEDRFALSFPLIKSVTENIPLAHEGTRHEELRRDFAKKIVENSSTAIAAFGYKLKNNLAEIESKQGISKFCLVRDFLRSPMRAMLSKLSGLNVEHIDGLEDIPQQFDDTISIKRRMNVERILQEIARESDNRPLSDSFLQAIGILLVSSNTLIGSIALSIMEKLEKYERRPLKDVPWDDQISRTALPLIEKICLEDASYGDIIFRKGETIRLFLESDGFDIEGNHKYSELFFAVGPHKCVGMNLSQSIWKTVRAVLVDSSAVWTISDRRLRTMDRVFNFYEEVVVTSHA